MYVAGMVPGFNERTAAIRDVGKQVVGACGWRSEDRFSIMAGKIVCQKYLKS